MAQNPDVAAAIEALAGQGILDSGQAARFGRVARGELVSIRPELRLLLYGGVLAIMGGVGIVVRENLERIGPVTIAISLWVAAIAALFWALRKAEPFTWGQSGPGHLGVDYILLLGVLLTGAAIAYMEVQFTPLGAAWSHHLLFMSLFAAALAFRCDSRMVFGVALTTFAAWRGVATSPLERAFWSGPSDEQAVRASALLTGLLFVVLAVVLFQVRRKPHFAPVASHLGWLLILGSLASGIVLRDGVGVGFSFALLVVGAGLLAWAFWAGAFSLFAMGVIGAYIGLSALVVEFVPAEIFGFYWFTASGMGVLVALLLGNSQIRKRGRHED
jgi:hypothetical protein